MAKVLNESQLEERIKLVERHVTAEIDHDVNATLATVSAHPHFQINDVHLDSRESVTGFYEALFEGFPDLDIEVTQQYVTDEVIFIEVVLRGTQKNTWQGIAATQRRIEVPACALYTFDEEEKIEEERAYFDVAIILRQLGVLPDPASG